MNAEYFRNVALKLQDELVEIIRGDRQVNEYELIVFKYVFSSELEIPLLEELPVEVDEDSFSIYVIPDGLPFKKLRLLDDSFDKFDLMFMPNSYNLIKLKFVLSD